MMPPYLVLRFTLAEGAMYRAGKHGRDCGANAAWSPSPYINACSDDGDVPPEQQ